MNEVHVELLAFIFIPWLLCAGLTWRVLIKMRNDYPKLFEQLGRPGPLSGIAVQLRVLSLVWGLDSRKPSEGGFRRLCQLLCTCHVLLAIGLIAAVWRSAGSAVHGAG